jgi:hypothetical protein
MTVPPVTATDCALAGGTATRAEKAKADMMRMIE